MTVPSPTTTVVKAYCFLIKFATTVLSESIIKVVSLVPVAPVQSLNKYSAEGVATRLATSPSLNSLVLGVTVPPSAGLAEVVRV